MNPITSLLQRAPGGLRAALLLALLGGCGGGVDSGGTGGATVYASGPINGYGSIIVNGVRFDDNSSNVSDDDGTARNRNDLKLGMVVEVRASSTSTDAYGDLVSTASSIVIGSEIVGPIDATPAPGAISFTVLGRIVDVKPTTVFADGSSEGLAGGLSALAQGNLVEVYGLYDALNDRFSATRIERKSSVPTHYRVLGRVSGVDTTTSTFSIGSLIVGYAAVPPTERPAGNGVLLRVRLNTLNPGPGGTWTANRLRAGTSSPDDGTESKLEGLIDRVDTLTPTPRFSINGVTVTTTLQTRIDISSGAIVLGARVEVEGRYSNGTLAASEVEVEDGDGDDFDFRGAIQGLPAGTTRLRINNVDIDYSTVSTWKGNGNSANDLAVGRVVRVRANLVNGTTYQAYEIEFRN
jgi:Domain of unknown function (DUF5666)